MDCKISRYKSICLNYSEVEGYFEGVELDPSYVLHHRFGEICPTEVLKEQNLYYNRPPCEFIWIPLSEYMRLHMSLVNKGQRRSIRTEFKKGEVSWNKGVPCKEGTKDKLRLCNTGKHHSEATRIKMSISQRRRDNTGAFKKGQHPWNYSKWRAYFERYKLNGGTWCPDTFKKYFTKWFTNF